MPVIIYLTDRRRYAGGHHPTDSGAPALVAPLRALDGPVDVDYAGRAIPGRGRQPARPAKAERGSSWDIKMTDREGHIAHQAAAPAREAADDERDFSEDPPGACLRTPDRAAGRRIAVVRSRWRSHAHGTAGIKHRDQASAAERQTIITEEPRAIPPCQTAAPLHHRGKIDASWPVRLIATLAADLDGAIVPRL